MTIKTLNESINKARKILEEETVPVPSAPSTVDDLTRSFGQENTITVSKSGIDLNLLDIKLKSLAGLNTEFTEEGDNIKIKTNNPSAVEKVLRNLGVSFNLDNG